MGLLVYPVNAPTGPPAVVSGKFVTQHLLHHVLLFPGILEIRSATNPENCRCIPLPGRFEALHKIGAVDASGKDTIILVQRAGASIRVVHFSLTFSSDIREIHSWTSDPIPLLNFGGVLGKLQYSHADEPVVKRFRDHLDPEWGAEGSSKAMEKFDNLLDPNQLDIAHSSPLDLHNLRARIRNALTKRHERDRAEYNESVVFGKSAWDEKCWRLAQIVTTSKNFKYVMLISIPHSKGKSVTSQRVEMVALSGFDGGIDLHWIRPGYLLILNMGNCRAAVLSCASYAAELKVPRGNMLLPRRRRRKGEMVSPEPVQRTLLGSEHTSGNSVLAVVDDGRIFEVTLSGEDTPVSKLVIRSSPVSVVVESGSNLHSAKVISFSACDEQTSLPREKEMVATDGTQWWLMKFMPGHAVARWRSCNLGFTAGNLLCAVLTSDGVLSSVVETPDGVSYGTSAARTSAIICYDTPFRQARQYPTHIFHAWNTESNKSNFLLWNEAGECQQFHTVLAQESRELLPGSKSVEHLIDLGDSFLASSRQHSIAVTAINTQKRSDNGKGSSFTQWSSSSWDLHQPTLCAKGEIQITTHSLTVGDITIPLKHADMAAISEVMAAVVEHDSPFKVKIVSLGSFKETVICFEDPIVDIAVAGPFLIAACSLQLCVWSEIIPRRAVMMPTPISSVAYSCGTVAVGTLYGTLRWMRLAELLQGDKKPSQHRLGVGAGPVRVSRADLLSCMGRSSFIAGSASGSLIVNVQMSSTDLLREEACLGKLSAYCDINSWTALGHLPNFKQCVTTWLDNAPNIVGLAQLGRTTFVGLKGTGIEAWHGSPRRRLRPVPAVPADRVSGLPVCLPASSSPISALAVERDAGYVWLGYPNCNTVVIADTYGRKQHQVTINLPQISEETWTIKGIIGIAFPGMPKKHTLSSKRRTTSVTEVSTGSPPQFDGVVTLWTTRSHSFIAVIDPGDMSVPTWWQSGVLDRVYTSMATRPYSDDFHLGLERSIPIVVDLQAEVRDRHVGTTSETLHVVLRPKKAILSDKILWRSQLVTQRRPRIEEADLESASIQAPLSSSSLIDEIPSMRPMIIHSLMSLERKNEYWKGYLRPTRHLDMCWSRSVLFMKIEDSPDLWAQPPAVAAIYLSTPLVDICAVDPAMLNPYQVEFISSPTNPHNDEEFVRELAFHARRSDAAPVTSRTDNNSFAAPVTVGLEEERSHIDSFWEEVSRAQGKFLSLGETEDSVPQVIPIAYILAEGDGLLAVVRYRRVKLIQRLLWLVFEDLRRRAPSLAYAADPLAAAIDGTLLYMTLHRTPEELRRICNASGISFDLAQQTLADFERCIS